MIDRIGIMSSSEPSLGETPRCQGTLVQCRLRFGVSTPLWQPKRLEGAAEPHVSKKIQAKARSPILGREEYSRKGSSLWETANPEWSFLNIFVLCQKD